MRANVQIRDLGDAQTIELAREPRHPRLHFSDDERARAHVAEEQQKQRNAEHHDSQRAAGLERRTEGPTQKKAEERGTADYVAEARPREPRTTLHVVAGELEVVLRVGQLRVLSHLTDDLGETKDLSKERPEMLAKVKARFDAWRDEMDAAEPLLGAIPELDSIAVVNLITALEEHFGITVADDEIGAAAFETLASLTQFVEHKMAG